MVAQKSVGCGCGVRLTEHIQFVIDAMKPHAAALGLERGGDGE